MFKLLVSLVLLALSQSVNAYTGFYLKSEPGDYIGGGQTVDLTAPNGTFSSYTITNSSGNIYQFNLSFAPSSGRDYFSLNIAAPNTKSLVADNYESASRFSSPTKPGLDVGFRSSGCNTSSGRFIVREAVFGTDKKVISFAADFEQQCVGATGKLYGYVRINSDIPYFVPTPNAAAGEDRNVEEGVQITLDGSKSSDVDGQIVSYQWNQLSGPSIEITNANSSIAQFTTPNVPEGGADLAFTLSVKDNADLSSSDQVTIHVANPYDPHTLIQFNSETGDYIGLGKTQILTIDDGAFRAQRNYDNGVSINFQGITNWSLDFAAANNIPISNGIFENATRYPFQIGVPGLNVSGDGRGCNTLTGNFVVRDVVFKSNNTDVDSFAADFEQHCEGLTPALRGTVLYNYRKPKPLVAQNINTGISEDSSSPVNLVATGGSGAYSYQLLSNPSNGTITGTPPNLTYTPNPDYFGSDIFTYQVNDGKTDSNVASVNIAIQAVNDPPVANDQTIPANEDTALPILLSATDIDNGTLQYSVVTPPTHGVISGSAPNLIYTPATNYIGTDSFTFKANDGLVDSNIATVNISIAPVNDAPLAKNDTATTRRNRAVTIPVLANDIDVDGNTLVIAAVSKPRYGYVSITSDKKQIKFTPKEGFVGTVTFTYSVSDGNGGTGTATVTVTVTRS